MPDSIQPTLSADPREARRAIRAGRHTGTTANVAPGYVQGNLAILPADWAAEFLRFCQLNPKPCPIIGLSEPGDPRLPNLGADLDIRTDVPSYRVFRDGALIQEVTDITHLWRGDFVAFVLGCSFSFESALLDAGVPLRHIERGDSVPMYLTNIPTAPAGRFAGDLVVSMRPFSPANAIRAVQITSRFPNVHGAPVHIGLPHLIGIDDIDTPWEGPATEVRADELPVFWACGVTPQAAIRRAKPPIAITHNPGHMVITDLRNAAIAAL
ncbi:MAG: putative hydro-lyase [Alphaproteobacteria bacterium]|nr:putative hydro-lyase [Alphaproteobacteria bacterium]